MTREQLEHAIRAACEVSRDTELWIFGSQALLGQYPDAPESLRVSIEVDVQPKNRPDTVDAIDGALGELSLFHQSFGFYVHGLPISSATLPSGWEDRTIPVRDQYWTRGNTGWCVESHDLAVSKLVAYREKDREFVRILLAEQLIDGKILKSRIEELEIDSMVHDRLMGWIDIVLEEMN
ncbi:MAG: DUF6036 family nucleotidyltransferase [Candidatus Auribacterota bacterium]|nr:DUF6036 family nucleotidyltransferase [Candidatus Auribacterota bacterium]